VAGDRPLIAGLPLLVGVSSRDGYRRDQQHRDRDHQRAEFANEWGGNRRAA
jgi:hypothetical protein